MLDVFDNSKDPEGKLAYHTKEGEVKTMKI